MKRLLGFASVMLLSVLLCIGIFAAETTVYVSNSGDDAKSGVSYAEAVKTFERAYDIVGSGDGKIVVCNYINVGAAYVLPEHDGKMTITTTDGENYFPLGKVAFSTSLSISGDTVFERIGLTSSGTSVLAAGGNDLTLGEDMAIAGTVVIFGGYNVTPSFTVEDASIANDYTITVKSGEYSYIRGGNRRADGLAPYGMISGNCTVNILGGEFTSRSATNVSAAAGMNEQSGNVTFNIAGGTFSGNIYAVGRGGTNETSQQPKITGNVNINVTGGFIYGELLEEKQDDSIAFSGKYSLNLESGSLPHIESIKGSASAALKLTDTMKNGTGTVKSSFNNPLCGGADPWVTYHDGYYYMTITVGISVYCYKSATLDGLAHVEGVPIWTAPSGDEINDSNIDYAYELWSPELHYVEADEFGEEYEGWWLYFAADDGENTNHRLYTVRSLTDDATGKYGSPVTGEYNIPVKMVVDNDETWAIGQSLLRADGVTYLTWTSETGRGTSEHRQDIRIAKLENPYTVGKSSVICIAEYDWEKRGYAFNSETRASYPMVVEGATAVYGDNGEIMIVYSASGYWTNYYCLSTLTLKKGADPLKKDSWIKADEPIFTHQNYVYGPGHAAYTTDAAGNRWMMYHGYLDFGRSMRYVFIQPYTLDGTTFDMNGGPYNPDTVFTIVNKRGAVGDVISGFGA